MKSSKMSEKKRVQLLRKACFALLLTVIFLSGCDKKDDDVKATSTETTAEFDNSNFGLYKGVIVGSSGTIKIEINNGNNVAKATITIDNETDALTSTSTLSNGKAISNATFNGSFSTFTFSVDANGKNPVINSIDIQGHEDVSAIVAKETSTDVALCYEGTSTGGDDYSGVFNVVRNNNTFSAICKGNDKQTFSFTGTADANGSFSSQFTRTLFGFLSVKFTISGSFSGSQTSGEWKTEWRIDDDYYTNSGTFTGNRKL